MGKILNAALISLGLVASAPVQAEDSKKPRHVEVTATGNTSWDHAQDLTSGDGSLTIKYDLGKVKGQDVQLQGRILGEKYEPNTLNRGNASGVAARVNIGPVELRAGSKDSEQSENVFGRMRQEGDFTFSDDYTARHEGKGAESSFGVTFQNGSFQFVLDAHNKQFGSEEEVNGTRTERFETSDQTNETVEGINFQYDSTTKTERLIDTKEFNANDSRRTQIGGRAGYAGPKFNAAVVGRTTFDRYANTINRNEQVIDNQATTTTEFIDGEETGTTVENTTTPHNRDLFSENNSERLTFDFGVAGGTNLSWAEGVVRELYADGLLTVALSEGKVRGHERVGTQFTLGSRLDVKSVPGAALVNYNHWNGRGEGTLVLASPFRGNEEAAENYFNALIDSINYGHDFFTPGILQNFIADGYALDHARHEALQGLEAELSASSIVGTPQNDYSASLAYGGNPDVFPATIVGDVSWATGGPVEVGVKTVLKNMGNFAPALGVSYNTDGSIAGMAFLNWSFDREPKQRTVKAPEYVPQDPELDAILNEPEEGVMPVPNARETAVERVRKAEEKKAYIGGDK